MQKNGVNGDHHHEASKKRVNPATFPCRLDLELCACGAKRWVDQNGNVATPWQFINLVTRRKGQESATTVLRTPARAPLDGLLTCGSCGQPMPLDDNQGDQDASYACQPGPGQCRCPTPRLHARSVEILLIGKIIQTVLTAENISRALAVANDPGRYGEAGYHRLTRQDLQEVRENPERFVLAVGGALRSRDFLSGFIAGIQIHGKKAVVCYSIPLPEDSPLAGARQLEIDLPEEVLT